MVFDPNALNIYTDESSLQKPRRGAFAMMFVFPEPLNKANETISSYGYTKATNNQMELKACSAALQESLKFPRQWGRIIIHTDSSYVCNNYKSAINFWSKNRLLGMNGKPIDNVELWKELIKIINKIKVPVDIYWVEGHSDNEENNIVDKLARKSAKTMKTGFIRKDPLPTINNNIRRKTVDGKTQVKSVEMKGQKMRIRVVSSERIPQNISKYRYEVLTKNSPYKNCIDLAYSDFILRDGHVFLVQFNEDQSFPQIVKVFKDITKEKREKETSNSKTD